jgi:hypothetical protein
LGEGRIRKAKVLGRKGRLSHRRPTMGEAAVAPETQMALRTPATPTPERMLKRSPRGAEAHKMVKILRQRRMVLPEAAQ